MTRIESQHKPVKKRAITISLILLGVCLVGMLGFMVYELQPSTYPTDLPLSLEVKDLLEDHLVQWVLAD